MKSTFLLILVVGAALAVSGSPARLRRIGAKSARQQLASDVDEIETKTPYPAAGFRPKIPFELPGERLPKALPAPTTTTTTVVAPAQEDVENFGIEATEIINDSTSETSVEQEVEAEVGDEVEAEVEADIEAEAEAEAEADLDNEVETETAVAVEPAVESEVDSQPDVTLETHTPANTYGAPDDSEPAVVVAIPSSDFQLPIFDAVRNFYAGSDAVANVDASVVADFPAIESSAAPSSTFTDEEPQLAEELDVESRLLREPADTYGAPQREQLPANTYGVPEISVGAEEAVENELASAAEQELEALSRLTDLRNGRLIFVPADGSILRQVYVTPVKQRTHSQSARLRQSSRLRQSNRLRKL